MKGETERPVLRLTDMLPSEVEEYFKSGGDAAIIPIGSIEQHGPHLVTGCDGYNALAKAHETCVPMPSALARV